MTEQPYLPLFEEEPKSKKHASQTLTLLALADIPGVGFATIRALYDTYEGNLARIWSADKDELTGVLRHARFPANEPIPISLLKQSERLLEAASVRLRQLHVENISLIFRDMPEYPPQLNDLPDPPAWIFVQGNVKILHDKSIVAVVGTREPTPIGMQAARNLSRRLVDSRYIILSGLALGIDAEAHKVAVDLGMPNIAVLGNGIQVVYPAATSGLRQGILNVGGAIVSEYLPRDTYSRDRFVRRNRIQAALSSGVAVIEGRSKSGTAHTVRFARMLKRQLFGAAYGLSIGLPEHELLMEFKGPHSPVFDLNPHVQDDSLQTFLDSVLPHLEGDRPGIPRLFQRTLDEVERLINTYDPDADELKWLIDRLQQRLDILREPHYGNQRRNSR